MFDASRSMYDATRDTINALDAQGQIHDEDSGIARLALEIAERIDTDGLECGVSLYYRLMNCITALRHEKPTPMTCPLAQWTQGAPSK